MSLLSGPPKSMVNSRHYKWWVYMAVGAGMFGTVVDQSGVIIAVPKIADRFALDIPTAQWINLIFILSTSALIMPLGRLSDILGGKRVYMGSIFIFVVGAIASGSLPR